MGVLEPWASVVGNGTIGRVTSCDGVWDLIRDM